MDVKYQERKLQEEHAKCEFKTSYGKTEYLNIDSFE
jgi:hypothetical protein